VEDAVPKSRVRKKAAYTPPPTRSPKKRHSPPWVTAVMLASLLIGLVWIVLFYLTNNAAPAPPLNNWNLIVGFGFILIGCGIATQWR
jgi:hypothetical protein